MKSIVALVCVGVFAVVRGQLPDLGVVTDAKCPIQQKNGEFTQASGQFMVCLDEDLTDKLNSARTVDKVRGETGCKQWRHKKERNGCGDIYPLFDKAIKSLPSKCKKPRNLNAPFMQVARELGTPQRVLNVFQKLQDLIWDMVKNKPDASACMLSKLRDQFLEFVVKCSTNELNRPLALETQLPALPKVPKHAKIEAIQEYIELYLKFFLTTGYCLQNGGDRRTVKKALKDATAKDRATTCNCKKSSISKFPDCRQNFNGMCDTIEKCIGKLIQKPKLFGTKKELIPKITQCLSASEIVELGAKAVEIEAAIKAVGPKDGKQFIEMMKVVADAFFNTGFCAECR